MNMEIHDSDKVGMEIFKSKEDAIKRKIESEQALIDIAKNTKPNWAERNPIKMLLIGVVIGFLLNYILELLKISHIGGL